MWKRLQALPPYQGGKRRLLGRIFKYLLQPQEAPVFVDPFLGGGAVSLFAKARGYRVACNDIALRSQIVGEAFITNDQVTLAPEDVTRLFVDGADGDHSVEEHFAPSVVTTKHARFLDKALRSARNALGAKKWLLLVLLLKYVLRMRPMGNFGAKTIVQQAEAGKWEEMNQNYVRDMLVRGVADHPRRVAEVLRRQVNRGVFSNGQRNEVHRLDVFQFLESVEGDILYLDPPYAGTSAYETTLRCRSTRSLRGEWSKPSPAPSANATVTDGRLTGDPGSTLTERQVAFAARHLALGKPQAVYERVREGYVLAEDARLKIPLWVQYQLAPGDLDGPAERSDDFRADTSIPFGARSELSEYSGSGFDRGHMAPAGDMTRSESVMSESFFLSNMAPQVGIGFNRHIWANLESAVTGWVAQRGSLTIITGPIFTVDSGNVTYQVIGNNHVAVPTAFYKIVVDYDSEDQVSVLAFILPNRSLTGHDLDEYLVRVDDIEAMTGLDFLTALPDDVETAIESQAAQNLW